MMSITHSPSQSSRRPAALWSLFALALILLGMANGCSRPFWREQADRDSYEAITENLTDSRWAVPRIDISPDPRSRFYDPYDPDYEPLPPDDPDAHVYMHWVDGWQGYNCWHQFGDLLSVENPQWLLPFNLSAEGYDEETGKYVAPVPQIDNLTLGEALELALINNRDYQTQIENVFLAALVVTGERFQFSVRYLNSANQTPGGSILGRFMPQGGSDQVSMSAGAGISQFLPTGGQWVVELVNNTIWLFGGGNETATASTLSFALTQPLLRGAGRKIVLESLTQAERDLLYAVRRLARFRREFFVSVVGGPSGFLNLLGQIQRIRNTQSNIFRLGEQVEALQEISSQRPDVVREPLVELPAGFAIPAPLEGLLEFDAERGELIWNTEDGQEITEAQQQQLLSLSDDPNYLRAVNEIVQSLSTQTVSLDVLRLQSQLANAINSLRQQERGLQDALDRFKILLGLPPDFLMTIDDGILGQFEFIDPRLVDLEQEIQDFILLWGQLDEEEPDRGQVQAVAERFDVLQTKVRELGLSLIRGDFDRLESIYEQRLEKLTDVSQRDRLRYDVLRDRRLFDDAVFTLEEIAATTSRIAERSADRQVPIAVVKGWIYEIKNAQEELLKTLQSLQAVEIGLRVEVVDLEPYEYSMPESVEIALENRLDLKNARAQVMDARRQVEVAANALKSVLDLEVAADFRTPSLGTFNTDPFDFTGDLSDFNVGLSFDTPIDQIQERNIYRQALINYQRARRSYMLAEDQVKQDIRNEWRAMNVLRSNLETARQALRISVAQFDNAVEQAFEPPRVGQQVSRGTGLQGANIQDALDSILRSQNDIIDIWVSYEQNRLNIYRDMGIMDVGPDNVWNDSYYREQVGESVFDGTEWNCPVDGVLLPTVPEGGDGPAGLGSPSVPPAPGEGEAGAALPVDEAPAIGIQTDERTSSTKPLRILGPVE